LRKEWTDRQLLIALAWIGQDMDEPSKEGYYLMQIAGILGQIPAAVWGNNPDEYSFDKLRIRFKSFNKSKDNHQSTEQDIDAFLLPGEVTQFGIEQATAWSIQRWRMSGGKFVEKGGYEEIIVDPETVWTPSN
jgi:hypothetical protein